METDRLGRRFRARALAQRDFVAPDGSVTTNTYNDAGLLDAVEVDGTDYVSSTTYNARGQRTELALGNGVTTTHSYDADTFRLTVLKSTRASDGAVVQALAYTYDPVGNIVRITNTGDTGGTLYFANGAVTATQTFAYDALYRLTESTGRERSSLGYMRPGEDLPFGALPDANTAVQAYTQTFTYDGVGNILSLVHGVASSSASSWSRTYKYSDTSNQLTSTEITQASTGAIIDTYAHDTRGSITYLPGLKFSSSLSANIETDFRDQVTKVYLATSGQYAVYWQDGGGQRVRKVVVKGGTIEERRYVGPYEVWSSNTTTSGDPSKRSTLHVMAGEQRVAMRDTLTAEGGAALSTPEVTVRYQLGNHLGSVAVELDEAGSLVSYEEYHPYGTTAWWAGEADLCGSKRFRYTGMERDEETGLQRHGVRYYAPWLGRWASADPIGLGDGVNRFCYCHAGPSGAVDGTGLGDGSPFGAAPRRQTNVWPNALGARLDFVRTLLANSGELRGYADVAQSRRPEPKVTAYLSLSEYSEAQTRTYLSEYSHTGDALNAPGQKAMIADDSFLSAAARPSVDPQTGKMSAAPGWAQIKLNAARMHADLDAVFAGEHRAETDLSSNTISLLPLGGGPMTLLHEYLHTLQSKAFSSATEERLGGSPHPRLLAEAATTYFAHLVLGGDGRKLTEPALSTESGDLSIPEPESDTYAAAHGELVKLMDAGAITESDLKAAYFLGDQAALDRVVSAWGPG